MPGHHAALIPFLMPIVLSAFVGGLGPGLVSTLLSFLAALYFLTPPIYSFRASQPADYERFASLLCSGILASIFSEMLHRANLSFSTGEARLRGVIDSAMDGIITIDEQQNIVLFNPAAEKIFQCPAADALGKPLGRFIPIPLRAIHAQHIQRFGETNVSQRAMAELGSISGVRANGEEFPLEASISQVEVRGQKLFTVILRDISERKRAQEMLANSEHRFRTLFENMLEGFAYCKVIFDEDRRPVDLVHLEVNFAFERLTGLQNVVGKKATEVIPGIRKSHPELLEIYGRVALTGQPEKFEIEFRPLASWFSVSVYSPQTEYIILVFDNITKRKVAEQIVKDDEEELTAIYDNVPLIMFLLDGERRICKANKFATLFAGVCSTDLPGKRSGEGLRCVHALDHPSACGFGPDCKNCLVRLTVLDTFATGRAHQQVEAILPMTVSGKLQDVAFLLSTARLNVRGQPRVLVTMQDISARKQAEEQLRYQLSLMKGLADKSTDSIFLTDREGRATFLNPEAEKVFGFTAAELTGQILHDKIHSRHPDGSPFPAAECPLAMVLETGQTLRNHEAIFFRKDGSSIEVSVSTALLEVDGNRVGTVYIVHDISERKQAARAKLRSEKMEALGTIAGGIAHDFNNILAAINGNAKLALADLPAGHPSRESLEEIAKAGNRAADLVRRILSFSRPVEQKREAQQLAPIVEEALKLVRATLPSLIEIHTDFVPDLPPVKVDSTQIHQVVLNLVTNAAYAIGNKSGRIDVRLDAVYMHPEDFSGPSKLREGRYVRLYLGDDGCGMDSATLERIFDPFFSTKPVGQGTGLGLSVVHGIVTSHQGAIAVYSTPGKGASFHLYFPVEETEVTPAGLEPQEAQRSRKEHVLYVDDEEALVFVGSRILERVGYQVTGFMDPQLALEEFRQRAADFDAVITDVTMPHMSGFNLAREMRAVRTDIPIVVTSGCVRPEDQQLADQLGIQHLILKPVSVDVLTQTLDRIFQARGRSASASSA
jgi:PAS domain S-box-containing protein